MDTVIVVSIIVLLAIVAAWAEARLRRGAERAAGPRGHALAPGRRKGRR